ncbi:hypothetical protein GOP47_0009348 [Adiantum capillus-veneris]|uniref:Uncharacterized protein n=1 Tax=Adiantum capillus-veneris TaxID=13818 RepID=A0A9D4UWX6_ADICA|nr:hypothetical protein GOP47_0009348 [Adiantum capillus-veneris]
MSSLGMWEVYWLCLVFGGWMMSSASAGLGRPTAMFILGDSLVDVGMNNHIRSLARANYRPNGIDYPGSVPTGRFCNGLLISDFLSQHWNMPATLAYTDPANTGETLLRGVNFASAGAGVLNDTGNIFNQRFRMSQQVQLFREYKGNITALVGDVEASRIVAGAVVSLTIGSNDFLANYFLPISPRRAKYKIPQYIDLVIAEFRKQVTSIYEIGARNIVIAGVGPFGCIPLAIGTRAAVDGGKCIDQYQQVAIAFNARLVSLADELRQTFTGATVLFSDAFDLVMNLIQNPTKYGFTNVNSGCCGRGPYRGIIPCNSADPVCPDRSKYVFWDPFHPTEAVNKLIAQEVLFGPPSVISPINLSQLFI